MFYKMDETGLTAVLKTMNTEDEKNISSLCYILNIITIQATEEELSRPNRMCQFLSY
jgi:hypothetical protein